MSLYYSLSMKGMTIDDDDDKRRIPRDKYDELFEMQIIVKCIPWEELETRLNELTVSRVMKVDSGQRSGTDFENSQYESILVEKR